MNGREFIAKARKWAKAEGVEVRFAPSEGPGSHGTLHAGRCKTTVKDRKKQLGKGLVGKMLADLGIDKDAFDKLRRDCFPVTGRTNHAGYIHLPREDRTG